MSKPFAKLYAGHTSNPAGMTFLSAELADQLGIGDALRELRKRAPRANGCIVEWHDGRTQEFALSSAAPAAKAAAASAKARMRMLSDTDGHSHVIADDSGDGGSTSEELNSEGDKHAHNWSRLASGEIVIGAAFGHSHVVLDASADKRAVSFTPSAATPTAKHAGDAENVAWLDGLPREHALEVAKRNETTSWGRAWLVKNADPATVAKHGPDLLDVAIAKRDAYYAEHVATGALDKAKTERVAYLNKHRAQHPALKTREVIELLKSDAEYNRLSALEVGYAKLNADVDAIRSRLPEHVIERARTQKAAEIAKRGADEAITKRAAEENAALASMTPSERLMHEQAAELAKSKGWSHARAVGELMHTSRDYREIAKRAQNEIARRRAGITNS